ncbi:hypothetical protein BGZ63DRAFT_13671 [Mariannaea sp. PMI_226]|nr:hypothetical protein BGZ63DRAFT_13671 [Mariannaea sp. PMI_226]
MAKKCKQRVAKHFGPIISSVFVNHTFTKDTEQLAEGIFKEIQTEYINEIEDTAWMRNDTKKIVLDKTKDVKALLGFSKEDPNLMNWDDLKHMFAGAAVESWNSSAGWTHVDDYLQMQKWWALQGWKHDLANPPKKNQWLVNAFDIDSYYSYQQNSIVVPAGIMFEPVLAPDLPSYVNFGGLGTLMGTEFAHTYDSVGMTFSANGSFDSVLVGEDQARYDDRVQCFFDKYDDLNITAANLKGGGNKKYFINGRRVVDSAIADTHGADAAYYAWKSRPRKDQLLAGFSRFTDDQMFWLFRSVYHCSKERSKLQRKEVKYGSELPSRLRSWRPLQDSFAWHRAFNCQVRNKVCRLYGSDENGGKYTKLKGAELKDSVSADATTGVRTPTKGADNTTETWNPSKYYAVPDDE